MVKTKGFDSNFTKSPEYCFICHSERSEESFALEFEKRDFSVAMLLQNDSTTLNYWYDCHFERSREIFYQETMTNK